MHGVPVLQKTTSTQVNHRDVLKQRWAKKRWASVFARWRSSMYATKISTSTSASAHSSAPPRHRLKMASVCPISPICVTGYHSCPRMTRLRPSGPTLA